MKNYKTENFHSVLKDVFGYAKEITFNEEYETPHGDVAIKHCKECTKEETKSEKPYPGEVKINNFKYYLLFS